jgi:arylsulfatase A-like enzyme
MTDQQRGDCLSSDGHPVLLTPNMDSIAGAGVRFSKAYTPCPTCIAARRSLLSGQNPGTHGMVGYQDGVEWDAPPTLPGVLKEAGYQTYLVGRDMHQHPARKRYGYDHMVTQADYQRWAAPQAPNIYKAAKARGSMVHTGGVMHNDYTARPWHLDESLHFTNWTVNEALKFLDDHDPSCPYFLTVSFLAPHPPLMPPAFYMERYLRMDLPDPIIGTWEEAPDDGGIGLDVSSHRVNLNGERLHSCRAAYYGLINHIDDQIRRFLNPVDELIDFDNTIILFTADHGEMLGDHYRWHKIMPYESSARIPLLLRAPDSYGIKPGTVLDKAVCLTDIMPTLLDMADIPVPSTVEGRSLLPLLEDRGEPWRDYLHIEHAPEYHCLTDGREKYIWFSADGREQLFDLIADPTECHDISSRAEDRSRLEQWRKRMVAELQGRPEGFSDEQRLIPGRDYPPVIA